MLHIRQRHQRYYQPQSNQIYHQQTYSSNFTPMNQTPDVTPSSTPTRSLSQTSLSEDESASQFSVRGVTFPRCTPHITVDIKMNNDIHQCILDSGCDYSMMPEKFVRTAQIEPINLEVMAVNGSHIKITGMTVVNFTIQNEPAMATVLVSD